MKELLQKGTTLIVDRYAYSGVAFSVAKGLPLDWCKNPDVGLPKPDVVIFMDVSPEEASKRSGFGEERYEKLEFQKKVYETFKELKDSNWKLVDASKDSDEVHKEIFDIYTRLQVELKSDETNSISGLWL
ncbi:hypothetical protein HK096_006680 [Nowakowskiella sp. JEL0078]|nr:hypothetical protein HK096_006680 [Nowakowskiella sp. JEL0078]